MTTSSMVCIRCAFARLLVPRLMHTQALINTGPGKTDFAPAKLEVRTGRVKEQITRKPELDCDEHVITN